ncbi:MAG: RpiB/LacA/LacB family sugar-phosphate isomerase [Gaiellaceae bacterium]
MRVTITADHNGVAMKEQLLAWLRANGYDTDDRGADVGADAVDYPPLCEDVCRRVLAGEADYAVVVGGGGSGETIACNKLAGIRAVACPTVWQSEIARGNNDANVLVLGAKVVDAELAVKIVETFLATPFKGAGHARRLEMIAALERGESLL